MSSVPFLAPSKRKIAGFLTLKTDHFSGGRPQVKDAGGATYHQQLTIDLANVFENKAYVGTNGVNQFTAPSEDNWTVDAKGGNDVITTLSGADLIYAGDGNDTVFAGGGNDTIFFTGANGGFDSVDGGTGFDTITVTAADTVIGLTAISGIEAISSAGFAGVRIEGSAGADVLDFTGATLTGIGEINGGGGADIIVGSAGADTIVGGAAADILTGGAGADTFVFRSKTESTAGASDHITDFLAGTDHIDLSAIDANGNLAGFQHFSFIGGGDFTGPGQLRVGMVDGHVVVSGNIMGNAKPDFQIILDNNPVLHAADFIL
jgi:Ca2+-binding RTX toxin-like protein